MKQLFFSSLLLFSLSYAQDDTVQESSVLAILRTAVGQVEVLLETQNSLENQVSDLQSQLQAFQTQYDTVNSELATARESLSDAEAEVRRLTARGERLEEEVSTLTSARDDLDAKLEAKQLEQETTVAEVRDLENQLEQANLEVTRLTEEATETEAAMTALRTDYSTVSAERDSLETVQSSFQVVEEQFQTASDALRARIVTLTQERDSFEAEVQGLQADVARLEQIKDSSQEQISALQTNADKAEALEQAEARITELEEDIEQARSIAAGDIETLRAQVLEMRDLLEASQKTVNELTQERDSLEQTLELQASGDYRLAKDLVLDVQTRIQTLQEEINERGGASPEQISELDGLRREFTEAQESVVEAIGGITTHVVQSGDTFSGLAERYYGSTASWPKIQEANGYWLGGRTDLRPNDILVIP